MGFFGRIFDAISVFFGTLMIGGLQARLCHVIKHLGVDSLESKQLMSKIVSCYWNIIIMSVFYQSLEFSENDLETMYCAGVRACPDRLVHGKDLVATFMLLYNSREFGHELYAISQSVKGKVGAEREGILIRQITDLVEQLLSYTGV